MKFNLPISRVSWLSNFARWGAELRSRDVITSDDMTWNRWEPTLSASGTMTLSAIAVDGAFYCQVGNLVFFSLRIPSFTTATAGALYIFISPPIPPDLESVATPLARDTTFAARIIDGGNTCCGFGYFTTEGSFGVGRYDGANWGLGAGRAIVMGGVYKSLD